MKAVDAEVLEISRKLSPKKRREWLMVGRELSARASAKRVAPKVDHDAEWERMLNDPKPRPALAALAAKALAEFRAGKTTPLPRL